MTLGAEGNFDVIARIGGGGVSGQAGALRLGRGPRADPRRPGEPPAAEEGRLPHPGRPGDGAEEVRPQEGPQGSSVLQALAVGWHPCIADMGRIFGTDGVRGVAGRRSDRAARHGPSGRGGAGPGTRRHPVCASGTPGSPDSRDRTRFSRVRRLPRGRRRRGLASSGVDVLRLGVIPTPGVAYLTGALDADFGVVLSASHNPAADNGIKFFGRGGVKLPDEVEDEIEARLPPRAGAGAAGQEPAAGFGRVTDAYSKHENYLDHLLGSLRLAEGGRPALHGLRIVVDCAHGAAYSIGPRALRRAGAEVIAIGAAPDGLNINAGCGSTHLETSRRPSWSTARTAASRSTATPTDASRWTGTAQPLDGDQILTVLASELKRRRTAVGRRRGGDGDVQPRLPRRDARRGHHRGPDPGRRQARLRRHAGRRLRARRRAVRVTSSRWATPPPATAC